MKQSIGELRKAIDEIDDQLLRLIERRTALSVQVGKLRGNANQDRAREISILARLTSIKTSPDLADSAVTAIWQCILEHSRQAQAHSIDTIKS